MAYYYPEPSHTSASTCLSPVIRPKNVYRIVSACAPPLLSTARAWKSLRFL